MYLGVGLSFLRRLELRLGLVRVVILRPVFHTLLLSISSELTVFKLSNLVRRDDTIAQALRVRIPADVRRFVSATNRWNPSRADSSAVLSRCSWLSAYHATISFSLMDTSYALRLSFASLMPWSILVVSCAMVGTGLTSTFPSVMEAVTLVDFMVNCGELLAGLQVPSDSALNIDDSGSIDLRVYKVRLNISIEILLMMATRLR